MRQEPDFKWKPNILNRMQYGDGDSSHYATAEVHPCPEADGTWRLVHMFSMNSRSGYFGTYHPTLQEAMAEGERWVNHEWAVGWITRRDILREHIEQAQAEADEATAMVIKLEEALSRMEFDD